MKKKELKQLAQKFAQQEKILQESTNEEEREKAKQEIMRLSSSVKSMDDMMALDILIQQLL